MIKNTTKKVSVGYIIRESEIPNPKSEMTSPNIILINMDNLGYGDLGCYGSTCHRTPHVDRLAAEGLKLTSFYSTSGVCTPSRASLMTGCYPRRVCLHLSDRGFAVLRPGEANGLHPDEITIAALLKGVGYATACVGKWHLGDQPPFLPTRHGFDTFFGCPYSEDMVPTADFPNWPDLPLMRNESVIEAPLDRTGLTRRYTEESVRFIREHRDRPFFLYLPHAMPGSTDRPFSGPDFQGRSANGRYGDSVEELDWSTGEILNTVNELGLDDRTLVIWTSDNGAVGHDPPQGSNAPLRGWGYDTSEGAQRMPCLMRWPGRIPAGRASDEVTTMMDILPTLAGLAGTGAPADRILDGHDIRPILCGKPGAVSPYDATGFFYYHMDQLQAVRSGRWKLYLPLDVKFSELDVHTRTGFRSEAALYDLRDDVGEDREVTEPHPDVVARLAELAECARKDLGDFDRTGAGQRPCGRVEQPRHRRLPS